MCDLVDAEEWFTWLVTIDGAASASDGQIELGPWTPAPAATRPWFALLVAAVFVVVTGAVLILDAFQQHLPAGPIREILAVTLGFLAACVVAGIRSLPLATRMSKSRPRNYSVRRKVTRAIWRGDIGALSAGEVEIGRRVAADSVVAIPWMITSYALLAAGIESLGFEVTSQSAGFLWPWVYVLLAVVYFVALLLWALRLRSARRFIRDNGEPAATVEPQPATT